MKLFHISDLHIGLRIHNRDMKEDQAYILSQIADRAAEEQPDAILIAGDIYDKAVPSADAAELFDDFVTKLSEGAPGSEIMMISGNHDSGVRLDTFRNILKHHRIHMIGTPPQRPDEYIEKVTLTDEYGDVNFYLLPFVRPSMVRMITGELSDEVTVSYDEALHILTDRENIDLSERNVLVSHQFYLPVGSDGSDIERMDSERVTVGNIDAVSADVLEKFDYAALGHIHKPMCVGSEYYRYCGTPLACSVSEAEQEKAIIIAELKEKHCKKDDGTADVPVSDNDYNYRNKITLRTNNNKIGYNKLNSNEIINIDECLIANKLINKLNEILNILGLKEAFSSKADFSNLTNFKPIFINNVSQKTFLEIDESGTTAVAVTSIGLTLGLANQKISKVMKCDKPYLIFFTKYCPEIKKTLILFCAKIENP